ncbi:MAG: hypothetical protein ACR2HF_09040 [Methylococcaceae bacterium]
MKYPSTHHRVIAIDGTDSAVIDNVVRVLGDRLQAGHNDLQRQVSPLIGQGPVSTSLQHQNYSQSPIQYTLGLATAILETYAMEVIPYLDDRRIIVMNRWVGSYYAYRCQADSDPLANSVYYQALLKTLNTPMAYIWLDTPVSLTMPLPLYHRCREHEQRFEPYMKLVQKGYAEYYDYLKRSGMCPYLLHVTNPLDDRAAVEHCVSTWLTDPTFIALFGG